MKTLSAIFVIHFLLFLSFSQRVSDAQERLGIAKEKPKSGRYVKVKNGYMVPYKVTIPGTKVSFEMVPIPGGMFRLETEYQEKGNSKKSSVVVNTEPCWIGKHEVTWAEYNEFRSLFKTFVRFDSLGLRKITKENEVDAVTAPSLIYDHELYFPSVDKKDIPRHPAAGMTHYAAKQYTKWLSKLTGEYYRLPFEAEWEHACRAGSTSAYCFGDDRIKLDEYAWHLGNAKEDTHPIGLKKPNKWGLHDMHGNVLEWVMDQYSSSYEPLKAETMKGRFPVVWPTKIHPRVVRGGSWDSTFEECQSSARSGSSKEWHDDEPMFPVSPMWLAAYDHSRQIGFRIVRPFRAPAKEIRQKSWDTKNDELMKALKIYIEDNGHLIKGIVDSELPKDLKELFKD